MILCKSENGPYYEGRSGLIIPAYEMEQISPEKRDDYAKECLRTYRDRVSKVIERELASPVEIVTRREMVNRMRKEAEDRRRGTDANQ